MKNLRKRMLEGLGYSVNDRSFCDIKHIIEVSPDYSKIDFKVGDNIVYSGAEHRGKPKLPDITILPNLVVNNGIVLGSSMGHEHVQKKKGDDRLFQEIYEFMGYGGMLLKNSKGIDFYILKPGEKVVVGTGGSMTIFNLGYDELITLDYANPNMNCASKNLENMIGPLMLISNRNDGVSSIDFKINNKYVEEGIINHSGNVHIGDVDLGRDIYDAIRYSSEIKSLFERIDIEICFGGNIPEELKEEFNKPLLELILERNKTFFNILKL